MMHCALGSGPIYVADVGGRFSTTGETTGDLEVAPSIIHRSAEQPMTNEQSDKNSMKILRPEERHAEI